MNAATKIVTVSLAERSYDIEIGTNNLANAGSFIGKRLKVSHSAVIADQRVASTHAATVVASFQAAGIKADLIEVPSGEGSKSPEQAEKLWNSLLAIGADRKTLITAVGGGVIGDLAGFIAATFARGVPFFQIPTTLLADVDSSVGGKVGVNLPGAKNMVGAFWQPRGVLIDTQVLATLHAREYQSGLAEVVKYGIILDADFFAELEQRPRDLIQKDADFLRRVIARCCELKAEVVSADEREETGARAVLNYGHTFAHAFETLTGYAELLHGEAVSIGMTCAARLARNLGRVDDAFVSRQENLLMALNLPTDVPDVDRTLALQAMGRDKKVEHGKLRFVLPDRLGHVELVGDVPPSAVLAAMER